MVDKSGRLKKLMIGFIAVILLFFGFNFVSGRLGDIKDFDFGSGKSDGYAVSSASGYATSVGKDILKGGGNAADAAIAMSYVLSVTDPYSSGIGGGGTFVVYDPKSNDHKFFDFYNATGLTDNYTHIGIPGLILGMEKVSEHYGSMEMRDLLEPARVYAENGIKVNEEMASHIQSNPYLLERNPNFGNNGALIGTGDTLVQADVAQVIANIQEHGSDYLYAGESDFAQEFMAVSGHTKESLQNYSVHIMDAMKSDYRGYTVYGPQAPYSGATTLQMLKMADKLEMENQLSPEYIQNYDFIQRVTYRDNFRNIYDSENNDVTYFATDEYVDRLLASRNTAEVHAPIKEHISTTSFSVIDSDGMVVNATVTLSNYWGSMDTVQGVFLNNTLKNFSKSQGNTWGYNKRPKTFISPLIFVKEDDVIALGSAGGQDIPQILFHLTRNIFEGEDIQTASNHPQFSKYRHNYIYETGFDEFKELSQSMSLGAVDNNGVTLGFISVIRKNEDGYQAGYQANRCTDKCVATE